MVWLIHNAAFDLVEGEASGYDSAHSGSDGDIGGPKVGDFIQWESAGEHQFKEPWKVARIDTDPDTSKKYLWCEGQGEYEGEAGFVPMEEAIVQDPPAAPAPSPGSRFAPPRLGTERNKHDEPPAKGYRKATFPLKEGDVTIIFPDELTPDGFKKLKSYLDVFIPNDESGQGKQENASEKVD